MDGRGLTSDEQAWVEFWLDAGKRRIALVEHLVREGEARGGLTREEMAELRARFELEHRL